MKTRTEEIIKSNEKFFDVATSTNNQIFKDVKKYLLSLIENGNLSLKGKKLNTVALQIQKEILKTVGNSKYYSGVKQYTGTIDVVEKIIIEQYANIVKVDVKDIVLKNPFRSAVVKNLENQLQGQAFIKDIIEPIRDVIAQQVMFGTNYEQASDIIEKYIEKNGLDKKMRRVNVGQVGRDLLHQYDGAVQTEIAKGFDFNGMMYIGGHVEDTRPICDHLADRESGLWKLTELQEVLDDYCPNGIPSNEPITYETIEEEDGSFVKKKAKKGSGMIEGTVLDNFAILRGGYGCLHEVIFIYL